ncbi:unnamed protein product [Adineta steineri]|uniref:Uncharacterized protein n=1 Tax=Adineta steineri TaxID=433720 RepID=A0A813THT6_9BILA|nr:unnamed protein product [Adineta steineri]
MGVDVIGEINYLTSTTDGGTPWLIQQSVPTGKRSNFVQSPIPITIHDLRGKETSVNLDTNAIEVAKYNGSIQEEFEDGSEEQKIYYDEISDFLKKRLGASRVYVYHYAFRSRGTPLPDEQSNDHHRNPVFYPHVDVDTVGLQKIVERKLGSEDGEKMKKNRFQMINIWRLIGSNPKTNKPLTICDYRSLDLDKDVRPLLICGVGDDITAYTLSPNAQDAHIWYYLSDMQSDEMFLFKIVDTKPDVAQFAFHTAFNNNHMSSPNAEQKSVELRCWVFYDD